jgi:hypothetical protein
MIGAYILHNDMFEVHYNNVLSASEPAHPIRLYLFMYTVLYIYTLDLFNNIYNR